ncbi:MAG: T9SS type A sorting domain-containing protein, partial [Bacteroidota bacterium]|nr:T9SS type A sorting domain-containing protein [Bacteroidota bacterium]
GTIEITIEGGTPPFEITLNGDPGSELNDGLAPGSYAVQITDANDCSFDQNVLIDNTTNIDEAETSTVIIHPNPANSSFVIGDQLHATDLLILDAGGRLVQQMARVQEGHVSIEALMPGSYTVSFVIDGDRHHQRLIKMDL